MRLLDRYLLKELLTVLACCLGGFLIFWIAFDLFSDMDEFQKAELRPHSKTVKTPILARKQIEAGAIGICCAKVGEAEVMVEGGHWRVIRRRQTLDELLSLEEA